MASVILAMVVTIAVKEARLALRLAALRVGPPGILHLGVNPDFPWDLRLTLCFFWILLAVLFVSYLSNRSRRWRYLAAATLAVPLWPDHDPGLGGVGGRLAASFIFLALPLIVIMADEIGDSRIFSKLPAWQARRLFSLASAAMLAILPLRLGGYQELVMGDDYVRYEKVVASLRRDEIPMLIAHRGLDFFYSYRLRRDAFHFEPDPEWKRTAIWRAVIRVTPEEAAYYSPPSCRWGEAVRKIGDTGYLLMREDCWELLRAKIRLDDNPDLYVEVWEDEENPSHPRPDFLRAK